MTKRWEIDISDAKGRWGCPPIFAIRGPGIYVTTSPLVAEQAGVTDHVYARELEEGETVGEESDELPEVDSPGPLSILDLRKPVDKIKTCEYCDKEYKWSHKRCSKRDEAEAEADKEPESEPEDVDKEPELEAKFASIVPGGEGEAE